MTNSSAPPGRKKGANPLQAAPSILHSFPAVMQTQDTLSPPAEQGRIAERLSRDYQRQAREQRGALAFQAASLARQFARVQRSCLGSGR